MWFRTLLDSLKPHRSRTPVPQARHGAVRRRPAARRFAIEPLEGRLMLHSVAVSDVSVVEGNDGARDAIAIVSLSAPKAQTVTVNYNTADGTALSGSDYQAASGKLTFAPGQTSKSIRIPVIGDRLAEPDETFFIKLRGAKGAKIADGQGVVTIVDDEPRISISGLSAYKLKGDSGTTPFTFTVSLSAAYDQPVTVNCATQDGTAIAGVDYLATFGRLTFTPGETTKTITVEVIGGTDETTGWGYKTFQVKLSGPSSNALLSDYDSSSTGTILEPAPPNSHWDISGRWALNGSPIDYDYYDFWGNGYMYSWEIGYYD